jgi:hypothetical protein
MPTLQLARSYVDFVRVAGVDYVRTGENAVASALGRKLGNVRCTFDRGRAPVRYVTMDWDASFLPVNTAVHAMETAGPQSMLTDVIAVIGDDLVIYRRLTT